MIAEPSKLLAILDRIPHCGCGEASKSYAYVRDLLRFFDASDAEKLARPTRQIDAVLGVELESGAYWLILYFLDHAKLCEHGTSVRCSWLTDDGRALQSAWDGVHESRLEQWCTHVFDLVHNPHCPPISPDWASPMGDDEERFG